MIFIRKRSQSYQKFNDIEYQVTYEKEKAVYRQLALPVPVFDYIKDTQRAQQVRQGHPLTINQIVSQIIREHQQQTVEREERNQHENKTQAIGC